MVSSTSTNGVATSPKPLNILIAGAGIGGLTAALALRRRGHKTTIFEQSRLANEIGAAINIAPNCNGILRKLGLFLEKHGAVDATEFLMMDQDSNIQARIDQTGAVENYKHPYHLMHRAHLHKGLKDLAISEEGDGTPCVLQTSSRVVDVDPETATITLENGQVFAGDAIIGADGVHSQTRSKLQGSQDILPFGSGMSGFRFLVDTSKLRSDPRTASLVEKGGMLLRIASESDNQSLVMYPCQNNEVMNCMLAVPTEICGVAKGRSWTKEASKDKMLDSASPKFGVQARAVLDMADASEIRLWELLDMHMLPTWVTGKLALLGDAAHPFTPWRGQGGAMAIEDAASLGALLPLGTTPEQVPQRLALYQECRRDRAHNIQDMSRKGSPLVADNLNEPKSAAASQPRDTLPRDVAHYMLGFDEWSHSEEALAKVLEKEKIQGAH